MHRFLAEVMVDAKYLILVKRCMKVFVQRARRGEVGAEGFFHHDPAGAMCFGGHAVAPQGRDDRLVELRRGGEVIDTGRFPATLKGLQAVGQALEIFGSADVARLVVDGLGKCLPRCRVERDALSTLCGRFEEARPPLVVAHRRPREADDLRVGRQ